MPQILKKRCNFTLRWLLDLGNTSEQNLKLKTWVICYLSLLFFYLQFDCPMANFWLLLRKQSLMLITAFGLSTFSPKVARRGWVSTSNWVPSGLWSQWHNPLNHSPQIAENTLPTLAPSFSEMWKCPQYSQNSNSLKLWWSLGLYNTSLDAKFSVQNSNLCWSLKSMS